MQRTSRNGKRTLVKRSSAVNLYADQAIQIQAIMEAVGARKEAPVIRDLLDEALAARRRKSVQRVEAEQPPPSQNTADTLQTIQTLLLKLIRQGDTGIRAQGISLILLQEVLAEANTTRNITWHRLEVAALKEEGMSTPEIDQRLTSLTGESKDHAYGVADEIRKSQEVKPPQKAPIHAPDQLPFEYSDQG